MKTRDTNVSARFAAGHAPDDVLATEARRAALAARHGYGCSIAFMTALGLMIAVPISAGHAQAPFLGTTANFSILAGAGITNTGNTVISGTAALPGDLGSSGGTITGFFPPGIVIAPGVIHTINDAATITARNTE